jgi:hypothetical protein
MTIVNDPTSSSVTLESTITPLELTIMPLENNYCAGITHNDRHITFVICLLYQTFPFIGPLP